jgi:hypothetical protein
MHDKVIGQQQRQPVRRQREQDQRRGDGGQQSDPGDTPADRPTRRRVAEELG